MILLSAHLYYFAILHGVRSRYVPYIINGSAIKCYFDIDGDY